jgi:hypothetical protein
VISDQLVGDRDLGNIEIVTVEVFASTVFFVLALVIVIAIAIDNEGESKGDCIAHFFASAP